MTESWRLFVSIPVPDSVKKAFERAQSELVEQLPAGGIRVTHPDQFHLTLRFLGNVEACKVDELKQLLAVACQGFPPIHLRAERVGFFPGPRYPRVIWARVHDEQDQLLELQKRIERAVQSFSSEASEKGFTGHVTLGRCHRIKRNHANILSRVADEMVGRVFGQWTADRVELIRSEPGSSGSRHTTIASTVLSMRPGETFPQF